MAVNLGVQRQMDAFVERLRANGGVAPISPEARRLLARAGLQTALAALGPAMSGPPGSTSRTRCCICARRRADGMATLAEIEDAEADVVDLQREYLRERDWKYTCNIPGAVWLWEKVLGDGRAVLVGPETAVHIQSRLDEQAEIEP